MPELERISVRNIGVYGLIRQSAVDDNLTPDGAVVEAINVSFDRIGAVQSRPGLTAIGSSVSAGNPAIGLHNAQSSTALAVFIASGSSTVYHLASGAWAAIAAGTGAGVIRFVDFANRTVFFGPSERSVRVYSGSNFDTNSGDPINPQSLWYVNGNINTGYIRPQFGEVYKSRIYFSGDNTYTGFSSRIWFSAVISSSGVITWSPSTDYVDINPADGENISALKRFSLELLIFKPNYTYRFRTSGVDPDPLIRVGTRSQESVVEGKRGLYFHHDTGFYRYSGGYPEEISRAVSDIVKAIPFGSYGSIAGWKDDDHIYYDLNGDITVADPQGNQTWKNAVLRYTESSDLWTLYSYSNKIRRGSPFITGTSSSIMVGLDNGVVAEFNKGQTDLGQPIKYRVVTKWYEPSGIENRNEIEEMCAIAEKGRGAQLFYQIDNYQAPISLATSLDSLITYLKKTNKFHRIRFILQGMISHESVVFNGVEIYKGTYEYVKNA